jgi:lysophospholipase
MDYVECLDRTTRRGTQPSMTDPFFDTPDNPRPDHATAGFLNVSGGFRIRYAYFKPDAHPPKGTVLVLAGRNECIEKYFETVRDLQKRGFEVALIDWRGQGASDRLIRDPLRGYVTSFDDYVSDLEQFFREIVLPDCRPPYYILAHSTGALIALLASRTLANTMRRMVLVAPFLGVHGLPMSMKTVRRLASFLYWIGLRRLYVSGRKLRTKPLPFEVNKLTSDPVRYKRNALLLETHPHLALNGPTVSWLRAACIASDRVQEADFVASYRVPTLLIAAGADEIVSSPAIEAYEKRLKVASMITIYGAKHELLMEADHYREQLLAAFDAFVPGSAAELPASTAADQDAPPTEPLYYG